MRIGRPLKGINLRDTKVCWVCGERKAGGEIDHILPVRFSGGASSYWNQRFLCSGCHVKDASRLPAPSVLPCIPQVLYTVAHSRIRRNMTETTLQRLYLMGPMLSRGERVRAAHYDYRRYGTEENLTYAQRLFWEVEALQEIVLTLHRTVEYPVLEELWVWCHEVLSYLHVKHGFTLQLPTYMPLL